MLEAPFTSAVDVGAQHYWFVPVRLLMKDQFRSDLCIGKVKAPVLVVHGENDTIVHISLGERLYGLVRMPKRFVRVAGAGHNDLGVDAVAAAKQFIAERPANVIGRRQVDTPSSTVKRFGPRSARANRAVGKGGAGRAGLRTPASVFVWRVARNRARRCHRSEMARHDHALAFHQQCILGYGIYLSHSPQI